MEEFKSKMVQVADGQATMLKPVEFGGRVGEEGGAHFHHRPE